MTSNYPASYSEFRTWATDIVHTSELLASRLGEGGMAKKSKRSGGQYKAPDKFKPFEDPVAVKLIEVLDMLLGFIYIQIKYRQLLSPPRKINKDDGR